MADDTSIDRTKVTFSQAEGLEPLPASLALGKLSPEARSLIWSAVYNDLNKQSEYINDVYLGGNHYISGKWVNILRDKHVGKDFNPVDEFGTDFTFHKKRLKCLIMEGEFNKVFDFLIFVMRHSNCPYEFSEKIQWALTESRSAYRVIVDGPTIIPNATPEEGEAISAAFALTQETGFNGARTHLLGAADALNIGDSAGCVRESIHAVESVAKRLNEDASTELGPALKELEGKIKLHGALKSGFLSIYGYTSDKDGIRHAMLDDQVSVDSVDATFMLGACASFVTYLINKAQKVGIAVD